MYEVAIKKAKDLELNVKHTCKVPGVFDMSLVVDKLLQKTGKIGEYDQKI